MTDQEMRIAIAKELGWAENGLGSKGTLHDPKGCTCFDGPGCKMPDYHNDLNAMHGAVQTMPHLIRVRFQRRLNDRAVKRGILVCDLSARDWAEEFFLAITYPD